MSCHTVPFYVCQFHNLQPREVWIPEHLPHSFHPKLHPLSWKSWMGSLSVQENYKQTTRFLWGTYKLLSVRTLGSYNVFEYKCASVPQKLSQGASIYGTSRAKFCRLTVWAWLHVELFKDSCFWIAAHTGKPCKRKVASSPLVPFSSLATSECFKGMVLQPLHPTQHCKKISLRSSHLLKPYTSTCQFSKPCRTPEKGSRLKALC